MFGTPELSVQRKIVIAVSTTSQEVLSCQSVVLVISEVVKTIDGSNHQKPVMCFIEF